MLRRSYVRSKSLISLERNEQYYCLAFNTKYEKSSTLLLNLQEARKRADSLRARTLINLSAVLLSAKVSNIDLDFVLSVAFISNVYIANSLRARILINLSVVLYKQAAARTSLSAKVSNINLNFVLSVAFISNVYIADSLRARTLINLSAVLYDLRARTLINLSAVLYEQVSIIDLNFVPSIAFNAIGNVELTGDLLGNADRVNNNNNNVAPTLQFSLTALLNPQSLASKRPALSSSDLNCRPLPAKRIKTNENCKKDNIEELICVSKVKNNCNNLNIMVTNPTSREFGRVDMKSLTRFKFYKSKNIQLLRPVFELQRYDYYNLQDRLTPRELGSIYVLQIVSKLDKVSMRELSSYIKTELYKFYYLIITSEDTYCKQTIKKAYIMLPERASLILFIT
ncbi:hypothetical protein HBI00_242850 [Parastagonospora nodorum]|nr:hypothetical protein HBI00_242850 [Parastagonospora nodorum]